MVKYLGLDSQGRRTYKVMFDVVTATNEDTWEYECTCGTPDCSHVQWVWTERAKFEVADKLMGDATP